MHSKADQCEDRFQQKKRCFGPFHRRSAKVHR